MKLRKEVLIMSKMIPVASFEAEIRTHTIVNTFGHIVNWYRIEPIYEKLMDLGFEKLANEFREELPGDTEDTVYQLNPAFKESQGDSKVETAIARFVFSTTHEVKVPKHTFVTLTVMTNGNDYELRVLSKKGK